MLCLFKILIQNSISAIATNVNSTVIIKLVSLFIFISTVSVLTLNIIEIIKTYKLAGYDYVFSGYSRYEMVKFFIDLLYSFFTSILCIFLYYINNYARVAIVILLIVEIATSVLFFIIDQYLSIKFNISLYALDIFFSIALVLFLTRNSVVRKFL